MLLPVGPTLVRSPDDAPGLSAGRIADRVDALYGLQNTLAAPLHSEHGVIGAIVLSRRSPDSWPPRWPAPSPIARRMPGPRHALTGLPNRRYFDEFCALLGRRRRADDAVGVLMIDIDRFKALNDRHGHATGDEVLRAVGGAIAHAVRDDDVLARYGGEEFAVLLRNPTALKAIEVGERVRDAVRRLDLRPFGVATVSVSVGVAVAETADEPIDDLLDRADRALYRAKRTGRDRVVARPRIASSRPAAARGSCQMSPGGTKRAVATSTRRGFLHSTHKAAPRSSHLSSLGTSDNSTAYSVLRGI